MKVSEDARGSRRRSPPARLSSELKQCTVRTHRRALLKAGRWCATWSTWAAAFVCAPQLDGANVGVQVQEQRERRALAAGATALGRVVNSL